MKTLRIRQRVQNMAIVVIACTSIAGCASKPPVRTAYSGTDNVGEVSADMLIGNWSVRVLNPHDGEQGTVTDANYSADGTLVMNASTAAQGLDMNLRMTGRWQLQGEMISQTLESIEDTSGSAIGALIKPFLAGMKNRATGTANVFEAQPNRLVLVSNEDGQALEYTRIP